MRPFSELLVAITDLIPARIASMEAGIALDVSTFDVDFPIEARIHHDAELRTSLPRGRLATGFDPLLGRVAVRFEVRR